MKQVNKVAAYALIALSFTLVACGNKPNDEKIQENLSKRLQQDAAFKGISAQVKDGVVTLTGNCEGEECATKAEQQIKEIEGVKEIENNIKKDQGTDLTLRTSVQSVISKYEGVQADVAAGVVVLRGSIKRNQVQALMNELNALKPKKLDNQLAIQ